MQICVHPEKRYLMWEDGSPYYPVADTAWTLPQQLTEEDVAYYATCRQEQGFNTILVCTVSELNGLRIPNQYGELPFAQDDPLQPLAAYWDRLDRFLALLWERGFTVGLLPTWGDKFNRKWGEGPEIFTPCNAKLFGEWIGRRYADKGPMFWVLGGDRPLETEEHREIIRAMAEGIRCADTGHLITFHPPGAASSVDFVPNADWLDFHSLQSSHGTACWDSAKLLHSTRGAEDKPCWDMECRYEGFPACFDESLGVFWSAADVRWNIYHNMMAGACGQSYGHRYIWRFDKQEDEQGVYWRTALSDEGAQQQRIAAALRCRGDYFALRPAPERLYRCDDGMGAPCAATDGHFIFVYSPFGEAFHVDLTDLQATALKGTWYDPRTGEERDAFILSCGKHTVIPPTRGRGQDWVLIIERFE